MNESWEDLLCRVFDDGFEAVCLDLIDPMSSQALQQSIRRAGEMEQRIRELQAALKMIHSLALDAAHGFDDDEALDRIRVIAYKALERKP